MLAASVPVANAIASELKKGGPGASEAAARRAYQALWPAKAKLQRDFHVFGGEYLMAQQAPGLRGFFNGFFKIPLPLWAVRYFMQSYVYVCLYRDTALGSGAVESVEPV